MPAMRGATKTELQHPYIVRAHRLCSRRSLARTCGCLQSSIECQLRRGTAYLGVIYEEDGYEQEHGEADDDEDPPRVEHDEQGDQEDQQVEKDRK